MFTSTWRLPHDVAHGAFYRFPDGGFEIDVFTTGPSSFLSVTFCLNLIICRSHQLIGEDAFLPLLSLALHILLYVFEQGRFFPPFLVELSFFFP